MNLDIHMPIGILKRDNHTQLNGHKTDTQVHIFGRKIDNKSYPQKRPPYFNLLPQAKQSHNNLRNKKKRHSYTDQWPQIDIHMDLSSQNWHSWSSLRPHTTRRFTQQSRTTNLPLTHL